MASFEFKLLSFNFRSFEIVQTMGLSYPSCGSNKRFWDVLGFLSVDRSTYDNFLLLL